jgi:hypothetical protein
VRSFERAIPLDLKAGDTNKLLLKNDFARSSSADTDAQSDQDIQPVG